MVLISVAIRLLIIVVCTVGFICSAKLYLKLEKSLYKTMSILFMFGFVAIVVGKVVAILGLYMDELKVLGSMHEIIGAVGLALLLAGLISILVYSIIEIKKLDRKIIKKVINGTNH